MLPLLLATLAPVPIDPAFQIETHRLWEAPAPAAQGSGPEDIPTLSVFVPQDGKANGTSVVVAPGGAYLHLAANLEGRQVADWFASHGVTAFVLKYRLGPKYLYPVPLLDAQRAVRWVRAHAADYNLRPDRIGMIGFSAGGHLTAMTAVSGDDGSPTADDPVDRASSRLNYAVLGYPWANAMEAAEWAGHLLYQPIMHIPPDQWAELEQKYTPARHVPLHPPPAFIYMTTDDKTVPVQGVVELYNAWIAAHGSAEMHIFRHGGHGSGLGESDPALDVWPGLMEQWLRGLDLLPPPPAR